MNNRSRLLTGLSPYSLIYLPDSICLPGKGELWWDLRLGKHLRVVTVFYFIFFNREFSPIVWCIFADCIGMKDSWAHICKVVTCLLSSWIISLQCQYVGINQRFFTRLCTLSPSSSAGGVAADVRRGERDWAGERALREQHHWKRHLRSFCKARFPPSKCLWGEIGYSEQMSSSVSKQRGKVIGHGCPQMEHSRERHGTQCHDFVTDDFDLSSSSRWRL